MWGVGWPQVLALIIQMRREGASFVPLLEKYLGPCAKSWSVLQGPGLRGVEGTENIDADSEIWIF